MTPEEMFNNGSAEEKPQETKPEESAYTFSTGTAEDYRSLANEISAPKQEYADVEQLPAEEPGTTETHNKVVATNTAKFLTNSIDRVMNITLSAIADDDGETDFSADNEEKAEMQSYWEAVFPDPTKQMPPWLAALIAFVLIYGIKLKEAMGIRKARKKIEEDAKIIAEQEREIERLRRESELLREKEMNYGTKA